MEIIKRSAQGPQKFEVLRSFTWRMGEVVKPGDTVEIENPDDQVGLCRQGKTRSILPATAVYIALTTITLPGKQEKFEAKKMELVELKANDALPLLLNGGIIPKDESAWRPWGRKLKKTNKR